MAAVLAAHAALKGVFFWRPYQMGVAVPVENATGGLVTTVTLAGVLEWVVLVGVLMVGVGRLRPRQIGLSASAFRDAVPVLVGVWVISQAVHMVLGSAAGGAVWTGGGAGSTWWAGQRIQAVVGSGLIEEVLYRGFLLTQLYAWFRDRTERDRAIALAVVASSVYFGLNHIPAGLRAGMGGAEAAGYAVQVALAGALFAILYLRTGNLFVAAGAHVLVNDPLPLTMSPVEPSLIAHVAVCALALSWPLLARRLGRVFTVGTLEGAPAF